MVITDATVQATRPTHSTDSRHSRSDWSSRLALITFCVVELAMFITVLVVARHQWFTHDEWGVLATVKAGSLNDLLRPHNGQWSTLPLLAQKGLFSVFGLRTYLPYQVVAVLLHLTTAALVRIVMRRAGVGPWIATMAASLFVLLGAGYQNIIWGIQGFVASLIFGLIQLILSDHDGPIDRRDWLGLGAGIAALLCSAVGVTTAIVVGVAALARRGWRPAAFHTAPLAAVYMTWWITYGAPNYRAASNSGDPGSLLRWVATGARASFDAMGQLPGVGIAIAVILVVGIVLAWSRLDRREVRKNAAVPGALLVGAFIFLLISGWARAAEYSAKQEISGGHYLHIFAAMTLPAIAVAANAVVRRWMLFLPLALAPLVVGVPGNLQALANPTGLFRTSFQIAYRQSMLSLVSVPAASSVPRSIRPDAIIGVFRPGQQYEVTMGWLLDQKAAGRLSTLPPTDLHVIQAGSTGPRTVADVSRLLADDTIRMSLQQTNSYVGAGLSQASSGSPSPVVTTANTSKLGTILVDQHGMTLYSLVKARHPLPCTGPCTRTWSPLTLPVGRTLAAGPGLIELGVSRSDRTITDWGFPLFRYSGDKAPGETNGNDMRYGDGVWRAVPASAPKSCTALVAPVVHRLEQGDSITFQGGALDVTYLAAAAASHKITFSAAKGNTLRATAGPLTVRLEPAPGSPATTVCM